MKGVKYYTIVLFITLIIGCVKENEVEDKLVIDNDKEYYKNYSPNLILHLNDSLFIDADNNGTMDAVFKINSGGYWLDCLNNDFSVSIGKFIGSGSGNLDTIAFNEIIDDLQNWHTGFSLFTDKIGYVGLKRDASIQTYGWIKLEIGHESIILEEFYFRKESNTIIKAGIKGY